MEFDCGFASSGQKTVLEHQRTILTRPRTKCCSGARETVKAKVLRVPSDGADVAVVTGESGQPLENTYLLKIVDEPTSRNYSAFLQQFWTLSVVANASCAERVEGGECAED